jgi:excisionase family DNA binding protein
VSEPLALTLPDGLVEQIAQRVAGLLREHAAAGAEALSPWLSFEQACAYLGFSPDRLYKLTAARAVPVRKKAGGQGLIFHRDELDRWIETAYPRLDRLP